MKVIITIPAYNEERTIAKVVAEIKNVMNETAYKKNYQILVLNDGSKDKTVEEAEKAGAIVYSNKRNKGLAETFTEEMKQCLKLNADIIVHTDADGQYPALYIPQMIKKIEEGYDLVLGSRFGGGNYSGSLMKKYGNIAFAKTFSGLLDTKLTDTTTGFRAFTSDVAKLPLINNFTYTQEQLIRTGRERMKIVEVPIKTRRTRQSRLFKNPLDYAIKAWINILRIYRDFAPLKFFGYFGGGLFSLGFLIGLYIIYHFITTGGVGGIPRVILTALLMLTGIQIITFGFLADMIKK
jgi:glycosyltransferase involved in cell wall biosynthesis